MRRVIIINAMIVGALISSLMLLWMKSVVGVYEVEVLPGLRTGISWMSNISTDFASHVGIHGFKCLLGTHLLIIFHSLHKQIHLNCKHVNLFNWMHTLFTGLESLITPPLVETIFSINALASFSFSEKNAPLVAASKWSRAIWVSPWPMIEVLDQEPVFHPMVWTC